MKKIALIVLVGLMNGCIDVPDMPEISSKNKRAFKKIQKFLECDVIKQSYYRSVSDKKDFLAFKIEVYDVRRDKVNYDSLNMVILNLYEENNYDFKNCDKIGFYYFRNHKMAILRKAYFYDNKRNLLEVAYR